MSVRKGIGFLLLASLSVLLTPDRARADNGWAFDLSFGDTFCGRSDGLCSTARQACESGLGGVYTTLVKMTPIFNTGGIVSDYACWGTHFLGGVHD